MPGPPPKDPTLRQRRNKTSTASHLSLEAHGIEAPALPARQDEDGLELEWHQRTLDWWADVWSSPMAVEFLDSDHHGLFLLAELEDAFHTAPSVNRKIDLAKEIRLQRQAFGLTPVDRRRLQWEIERADDAQDRAGRRGRTRDDANRSAAPTAGADPRLSLVK